VLRGGGTTLHIVPFAGGAWLLQPDQGEIRLYHEGAWRGPFRPNVRFAAGAELSADELLLNTPEGERPFALYAPEDGGLRPFGEPVAPPHPELRDEYNSWVLGATADGWVAAHRFQPLIAAFGRHGEPRWQKVVNTPAIDRLAHDHAAEIARAVVDPSGCCISARLVHLAERLQVGERGSILINYSASPRLVEVDGQGKVVGVLRLSGEGVRSLDRFGFATAGDEVVAGVAGALRVFQPAESGRLQGRVIDEEGQPIAQATVTLATVRSTSSSATEADGSFWLARTSEAGTLRVEAEGYLPVEIAGHLGEILARDLVLRREPELCLRVVDAESGEPVPRFRVAVDRRVESARSVSTTPGPASEIEEPAGRTCLRAPFPPPLLLTVEAEGRSRWERRLTDTREVLVELGPEARLSLIVRSSEGAPVAEADAFLAKQEVVRRAAWEESFGARADERGELLLDGIPPGPWVLVVRHPDYLEDQRLVDLDAETNELEVALSAGSRALVRVARAGGEPVGGAKVTLAPAASVAATAQECVTDRQGTCSLHELSAGRYVLGVAWRDGAVDSRPVEVVAAQEVFEVELESRAISGQLFGMEPYGDVQLAVRLRAGLGGRLDAPVEPGGRFLLEGVEPGSWAELTVRAMDAGGDPWEVMTTAVRLPREGSSLELELPEPLAIFGQVRQGGRPCAGCVLVLRADPAVTPATVRRTTAADGTYRALLPAAGSYVAEVASGQESSHRELAIAGSGRYDVELESGALGGRVVRAEDGTGVADASVVLRRGDGTVVASRYSTSEGGFHFSGLAAGEYHLSAQGDEGAGERRLHLAAGATEEATVELESREALRLRLVDAQTGAAVVRGALRVYDATNALVFEQPFRGAGGEILVPVAGRGPYSVVVRAYGFGLATLFDLSPGDPPRTAALRRPSTLVVEPGPAAEAFALLDATGRPIALTFELPPGAVSVAGRPLLFEGLAAGPHVAAAGGTARSIDLVAGRQTVVELSRWGTPPPRKPRSSTTH
ncbi:MAG TPA: carboxypeptidase-like regulatory domain-containing protein, partial [Thermoanaerobaculia bacterium]|nr:carboxypeptidase-like regulatory domain-containing protein [Thermoanaerobaculia bacterium]